MRQDFLQSRQTPFPSLSFITGQRIEQGPRATCSLQPLTKRSEGPEPATINPSHAVHHVDALSTLLYRL